MTLLSASAVLNILTHQAKMVNIVIIAPAIHQLVGTVIVIILAFNSKPCCAFSLTQMLMWL